MGKAVAYFRLARSWKGACLSSNVRFFGCERTKLVLMQDFVAVPFHKISSNTDNTDPRSESPALYPGKSFVLFKHL